MANKPAVSQVVAVLELLIRFHPAGMSLLANYAPSEDDIRDLVRSIKTTDDLGVRVMGGHTTAPQERDVGIADAVVWIIDGVGSWVNIWIAAEEYRNIMGPDLWREITDYVTHIRPGGAIHDGAGGYGNKYFGARGRHDISLRTARRRFRDLLRVIATKAMAMYNFDLAHDKAFFAGPR